MGEIGSKRCSRSRDHLVVAEELHHRLLARPAARLKAQAKHSLCQ